MFARLEYYIKWQRLFKWEDGMWRAGIIIGKYRNQIVIELDDGGIFTVDKGIMYSWKRGWNNKPWRKNMNKNKNENLSMCYYHFVHLFTKSLYI